MLNTMEKSLEKMGLSEKESRVYISGLEMGKFSVLALSERTGIKRPTCYLILDELIKKGLISTFPKAKKVLYVAEHPNALLKNTADAYAMAKNLMPELQALMDTQSEKPSLKVYTGEKGIQGIYEDVLETGETFRYIASVKDLTNAVGKEFLDEWIKRRIAKKMSSISIRVEESELDYPLYGAQYGNLRDIRYAPKGFKMPYSIFIYGKKVAFMATKEPFGFIVESADLSTSMRALFEVVWNTSKE